MDDREHHPDVAVRLAALEGTEGLAERVLGERPEAHQSSPGATWQQPAQKLPASGRRVSRQRGNDCWQPSQSRMTAQPPQTSRSPCGVETGR